jgi:perosamine synthetase
MIPVYRPFLNSDILSYAHRALDSTWISSKGENIPLVERYLSQMHSNGDVRINNALVCCNGTAATHLLARLLRKAFPTIRKLIVPNNVYVAAWNAFLYDGAFELEAIEADLNTWNWDTEKLYDVISNCNLEETAVLAVHNLGNIVNVPKILQDWKGLVVLEDNCEGFLGKYGQCYSGTLAFASSISFFGNKTATSGEGGAVIAPDLYKGYIYKLRSQGQSDTRFVHDEFGYNYRMTNVQAAILRGQLENIETIVAEKERVFSLYRELLADVSGVSFQKSDPDTKHSNWMIGIRIDNSFYDNAEKFFNKNFIEVRPMFYPIHAHTHLNSVYVHGDSGVAEKLNRECIVLPSYPELEDHEICHVANTVKKYIAEGCK